MSPATRQIGNSKPFDAISWGAMSIGGAYGGYTATDEEAFKFLDAIYDSGCRHWDTADIYGPSEHTIGKWMAKNPSKRDDIFLATKFGFVAMTGDKIIDGSPEYARKAVEKSLKRLQVESIDLYYLHRADSTVPIEHTVSAMAEFVKEGKVKYLGLSEVSASTLRRAHAVHPIAAVQVEYSPWTLDIEDPKIGLLATCRELGVKVVAYAPLGRGLLSGHIRSPDDLPETDFRRKVARYNTENFPNILKIADGLKEIGAKYDATAGQVALAWLLAQGDDIIPIPGTKTLKYLEENLGGGKLTLSAEDVAAIRALASGADAQKGLRYPPDLAKVLFVETPAL
ncbi:Aldo/keto reductase [Mycena kentingensis (nom. inval.)]|nr:Aldo/keto reductase [Mycena kentingensis (nom. inval.)]